MIFACFIINLILSFCIDLTIFVLIAHLQKSRIAHIPLNFCSPTQSPQKIASWIVNCLLNGLLILKEIDASFENKIKMKN